MGTKKNIIFVRNKIILLKCSDGEFFNRFPIGIPWNLSRKFCICKEFYGICLGNFVSVKNSTEFASETLYPWRISWNLPRRKTRWQEFYGICLVGKPAERNSMDFISSENPPAGILWSLSQRETVCEEFHGICLGGKLSERNSVELGQESNKYVWQTLYRFSDSCQRWLSITKNEIIYRLPRSLWNCC